MEITGPLCMEGCSTEVETEIWSLIASNVYYQMFSMKVKRKTFTFKVSTEFQCER